MPIHPYFIIFPLVSFAYWLFASLPIFYIFSSIILKLHICSKLRSAKIVKLYVHFSCLYMGRLSTLYIV